MKTKCIFTITLILLITLSTLTGLSQHWDWAHSFSTTAMDMVFCTDICSDNEGNVYVTGDCESGIMTVAGYQAPYTVGGICFVAKFNNEGSLLLLKIIQNAEGRMIAVDSNQNIYVYGHVNVLINFAGSTYFFDNFLAKYDSMGNEEWVLPTDSLGNIKIAISPSDNVGFFGQFSGTTTIDTFSLTAQGYSDILVGEIDPNGNFLWINSYGGNGSVEVHEFCYDNYSNMILGGRFTDTLCFDNDCIYSGFWDLFISGISAGGDSILFAKSFPYQFSLSDITINSKNEVLFCVSAPGSNFTLDTISIINPLSNSLTNNILCKLSSAGDIIWAKNIYAHQKIIREHIDINSLGEIILTGTYGINNSTLPMDIHVGDTSLSFNYPPQTAYYPFIVRFRDDGEFQMGDIVYVSDSQNETNGLCLNNNDDIFITGFYLADTMFFGIDTFLTNPSWPMYGYIAKYDDCSFQNLKLKQGWSIVSSYIDPNDTSVQDIFSAVDTSILIMKSAGGLVYWPQYSVNQIGNWQFAEGYQVKMSETRWVKIYGNQLIPEQTPVPIQSGWQIISYLRYNPWPVDSVFNLNSTDVAIMKNGNGQVYWPQYNLNVIGNMQPGEGYQLRATNPFDLYYPANE